MVRSDSSAIAICISQATNFPQILTRLSLSLSLALSCLSPPLAPLSVTLWAYTCSALIPLRKCIIVPISVGAGNAMQQKHMQHNVNKVHVAFIIMLLFYFSVCLLFFLSFSESVFEFRWIAHNKGWQWDEKMLRQQQTMTGTIAQRVRGAGKLEAGPGQIRWMQTEVGLLDLLLVPASLCDRPMRGSIQRFVRPMASLTLMGSAPELVELIIA